MCKYTLRPKDLIDLNFVYVLELQKRKSFFRQGIGTCLI